MVLKKRQRSLKWFLKDRSAQFGLGILSCFIVIAFLAPVLTANQIAMRYKGHNCARDLSVAINLPLLNKDLKLPELARSEPTTTFLNPLKPYLWRLLFFTPRSCYIMPQDGRQLIPIERSGKHILGQAAGGYDLFYGLVWGARLALIYGLIVTSVSLGLGILFGGLAGYFGGRIDTIIMRLIDTLSSFPSFVFALIIASIFGRSMLIILLAFSLLGWFAYARYFRAEILRVRSLDYIEAAKSLGMSEFNVFKNHIAPNTIMVLVTLATLDIGLIVLQTSALSFLGFGGELGFSDWGQILNFSKSYLIGPTNEPLKYWFTWFWPGFSLFIFVLAWSLLGDAYRQTANPKAE